MVPLWSRTIKRNHIHGGERENKITHWTHSYKHKELFQKNVLVWKVNTQHSLASCDGESEQEDLASCLLHMGPI